MQSRTLLLLASVAFVVAGCGSSAPTSSGGGPPPPTMGILSVASTPSGAEIWLDGAATGKRTPAALSLLPRVYATEIRRNGYLATLDSASIAAGDTTVLYRTLSPGSAVYLSQPGVNPGVVVSFNGGVTWQNLSSRSQGGYLLERLASHPTSPLTLYAAFCASATDPGSVIETSDGGATWTDRSVGLMNGITHCVRALAMSPSSPDTMFAGIFGFTRDGTSLSNAGEVFVSLDGGATWTQRADGLPHWAGSDPAHVGVWDLAVDPADGKHAFAAVDANPGLYQTTDAGAHWSAAGSGIAEPIRAVLASPHTSATLYATGYAGTYRSTNAGATWQSIASFGGYSIAIAGPSDAVLLVGGDRVIHRSSDAGATWQDIQLFDEGWPIPALAVDARNASRVYACSDAGAFRSEDAGQTWVHLTTESCLDVDTSSRPAEAVP